MLFKSFDANGDGVIDFDEFLYGLKVIRLNKFMNLCY